MSQVLISSPKHCAKQGFSINRRYKKLFFALSTFFTTFLALVFLIWVILHPTKPRFTIKEADIDRLDLSGARLNSSMQLTLLAENPNTKVGIYYDELQAYASYKGQRITTESTLPPFYQGHEDSNLLSASLVGNGLPVATSLSYEVGRDQTAGKIILKITMNGQLRWKVGSWVSGRYRVNVACFVVMALKPSGVLVTRLSSKQGSQCSTSV